MKTLKAYHYRLKPKLDQVTEINQHFGSVHFVKNWAIALRSRYYKRFGKGVSPPAKRARTRAGARDSAKPLNGSLEAHTRVGTPIW